MNAHSLTPQTYHADTEYLSVSKLKRFLQCEVLGTQPWGEPSEAMLIGSYVDAFVEGTLDAFKEAHPEILSSRGASKGELKQEFKNADDICKYISEDEVFMQFMSGEKQRIMVGTIAGVPVKIMMDSYSQGIAINDLKVMRSVTNSRGEYYDFITPWGYDLQMAVYQEIESQNTLEAKLPTFICAVTKETPINSVIVRIPQVNLDIALYKVEESIRRFKDIVDGVVEPVGCGKCKACIAKRKRTPIISMEELV